MDSNIAQKSKIKILGIMMPSFQEILTDDAMDFLTQIQEEFGDRRLELLNKRKERVCQDSQQKSMKNGCREPFPGKNRKMCSFFFNFFQLF